jgi:hypothetical protein
MIKLNRILLVVVGIVLLVAFSGCSEETHLLTNKLPDDNQSTVSSSKKDMLLEIPVLIPGNGKIELNINDYDQYGLEAFKSLTLRTINPKDYDDHCKVLEIFVDFPGKVIYGECSASNFLIDKITVFNHGDEALPLIAMTMCQYNYPPQWIYGY